MKNKIFSTLAASVIALMGIHQATAATYDIDLAVGDGLLTGFIETDDTIGVLASSNITDWSFTMTSNNLANGPTTTINRGFATNTLVSGSALSATATELVFDFSAPTEQYLAFQDLVSFDFVCLINSAGCFGSSVGGLSFGFSDTFWAAEFREETATLAFAENSPTVVPTPAGLPLMLGALGVFGVLVRAKKHAA